METEPSDGRPQGTQSPLEYHKVNRKQPSKIMVVSQEMPSNTDGEDMVAEHHRKSIRFGGQQSSQERKTKESFNEKANDSQTLASNKHRTIEHPAYQHRQPNHILMQTNTFKTMNGSAPRPHDSEGGADDVSEN